MKKKTRKNSENEIDFWQSSADMFSALLLVLMLVILVLGLYLVHIPEYNQKDPHAGDTYAEGSKEQPENTYTPQPTLFFWFMPEGGGDGMGGGSETPHPTYFAGATLSASPSPTVSPTPDLEGGGASGGGGGTGGGEGSGEGPGEDPEMGMKSAVYVMLVDAETERTIKEPNVQFELYGGNRALQVLNVYYPERLSFRMYETTENGTFYLPEKLPLGTYELHELTEPEGYDAAENVEFQLAETYDWADPLVVEVPIYPSRNIIRVQLNDVETGRGVSGGTFAIIADENIVTADGTLRYRAGQQVGEIVCDETGYGESEELYLGKYHLAQTVIPDYYAALPQEMELPVEVSKRANALPPVQVITSQRTRIHLAVKDETNTDRPISGAVFSVSMGGRGVPEEVITNSSGEITLDTLQKGVTYQITQVQAPGDYKVSRQSHTVSVTADGRIDGEAVRELEIYNHVIRVAIGITDEFSSVQVPNVNLALYDGASNTLVRTWTSTGVPLTLTTLNEGPYYLYIEDRTSSRYDFTVRDQAELQTVNLYTTYLLHYLIYGGMAVFGLGLLIAVWIIIRRFLKKRKQAQDEN